MSKKKTLGKSMDALFDNQGKVSLTMGSSESQVEGIRNISIDLITPSADQPRSVFDNEKIESLSLSIKSQGIIQPIVVIKSDGKNLYKIIAGERRWRAAKLAGLKKVPVIVRSFEGSQASVVALVENLHREDLSPMEKARALSELTSKYKMKQQELAQEVGLSRSALTNLLRLLKLSLTAQKTLENGDISEGHAKVLCALPESYQDSLVRKIKDKALSVRQLEKCIELDKDPINKKNKAITRSREENHLKPVIDFFEEFFTVRVSIDQSSASKGKVCFHYNSLEELEGMIDKLGLDVENRF